jgi:hypothetical protein
MLPVEVLSLLSTHLSLLEIADRLRIDCGRDAVPERL